MMTSALMSELARQNIRLLTDGERLTIRAPKGVVTPELRLEFASQKADLIAMLRERRNGNSHLPRITPCPSKRYEPFPLTEIQRAYVVGRNSAFDLGNVSCHVYYEVDAIRLDMDRFNRALQLLIDRHDMLRAVVRADGRQQVLEKVPSYQIPMVDLRGEDGREAQSKLDSVRAAMSHQVRPADRWPLFDCRASRLDDERVRLHLSFDTLIVDVWSLRILFQEWRELYEDPNAKLVPLDISFREYVLAEPMLRATKEFARSSDYWSKRLPSLPAGPELPLATNPRAVSQPRFIRHSGRLDARTWSSLKERAGSQSLTPSGLLLAAFAEVLTRWSKSSRFAINVTLLNRLPLHPQVGQIVGDFTSLVPLEVDNSGSAPFSARAARIQSQLLEDIEHRYLSGVEIMRKAARAQGKTSVTTLPIVFTSLLNQDRAGGSPSRTLWMGEVVYGISQTPQVWLDHQIFEEDGVLVFHWDAVDELFPAGLLPDMFDAYCRLLQTLASEEHAWTEPLGDLIPKHQLAQREVMNATDGVLSGALLQDLFAEQAKLHPDQTAVISGGRRLSYRELDRLSNQVANRLRVLGARPNKLVAVVMEKGWEQVVAVLGVLKSGAAYLPIDPALPQNRLWYLLEHNEVDVALSQAHLDGRLKWPESVKRLCLDETSRGSAFDLPPEPVQRPDDLAYVIYTSGSTGLPKGVMVDHRGAVNTITDINRRFGVGPSDKLIALSDLSFDLSVYDVFGTLAAGATLVIPDADRTRDPAHWLDLVRREDVTVWNSVPALMEMMAAYAFGKIGLVPSLRLALLSGDWISVKLPERVRELAPELQLISLGGATEASIWSIYFPIEQVDPEWRSIPYGRPLRNQKFEVLDGLLKPCPVWVPGELYIGGIGLARGYWRDEEKTSASFITHPATGERLYKTGDLGRYLPGGSIEFLGREDSQVKVQGHRIELGEIEAVMAQHPAIQAAAARAVGNAQGSKRLVAYVVANSDVSRAELSSFLGEKLPSYMIPSRFIHLEAMPLTANGKIDRAALPDPPQPESGAGDVSVAADTAIEAVIAAIIAAVLQIDRVKPNADLFELGATSLDIIRIARLMEDELGYPQKIADFFHYPTVVGLAEIHQAHLAESHIT